MRWLAVLALLGGCEYVFRLDEIPPVQVPDASPPDGPDIAGRWAEVATGRNHTCAIDLGGALWCWGYNDDGEAGVGLPDDIVPMPTRVGSATWTRVVSKERHSCGLQTDGSLWCWGYNNRGELGDGTTTDRITPTQVAGTWIDVAVEAQHTCAVRGDATLWCWGDNEDGELGDGTQTQRTAPVQIGASTMWTSVTAGPDATCALDTDKALWCWGANPSGIFSVAAPTASLTPFKTSAAAWDEVELGNNFGCGIRTTGVLECWGGNSAGQLGDGTESSRPTPAVVAVPGTPTDWVELTTATARACARTASGRVFCWGTSTRAQAGIENDAVILPVELDSSITWLQISAGPLHTCGIGSDDKLWCIGSDAYSELGDGGTSAVSPVQVPGTWNAIAAGHTFTCAIDSTGRTHCAGDNSQTQLGLGHNRTRDTMAPNGLENVETIAAGVHHACASRSGQLYCWGGNYAFQLGSTGDDAVAPVQVRAGSAVSGQRHTCTLDGTTMWCWGDNTRGQIGTGDTNGPVGSPFEISGKTWNAVGTGYHFTCGIDTAGAVHCWGAGTQTGQNISDMTTNVASPTANGVTAAKLSTGGYHACAIRTDASATCWGAGYEGQVGIGNTSFQPTPVALPGAWSVIGAGYLHTCGIKTDGTLWCWGLNDEGQLGVGFRSPRQTTPMQVGTDTDWADVSAGNEHTCARKTNGAAFCWGNNSEGSLATGEAWRTTLVQVP